MTNKPPNTIDDLWELPLFQVTIARDGEPDMTLTVSPRRWCDLQAAFAIEFAQGLQIEAQVRQFAEYLGITCTPAFENCVLEVIGGTIMQVLRGRSTKELAKVFADVVKDPPKAISQMGDSKLSGLVIMTLCEQVSIDPSDPWDKLSGPEKLRDAAKRAQTMFGEPPAKRGRPREDAKLNFFEGVVAIARAFGAELRLPQHDQDRGDASTPLFMFGEAMLDLMVCQGSVFAHDKGLSDKPFNSFIRLGRTGLIVALERARVVVLAESPTQPIAAFMHSSRTAVLAENPTKSTTPQK
jgi:hypothetical protein